MLCPYCQNEMQKGFIESRDDLGWNEKKHPFLRVTALTWTASDVRFGKTCYY